LFGGERKKKQERKGEKRKSDGEVMVENRNGTRLMRRERSRFCEKRDQDILNNPPPPPHNRENPKEMLESRKHNPTDPEPIFQKNQALFAYPLTRKREARKVSKMNTSSHTPKQASK